MPAIPTHKETILHEETTRKLGREETRGTGKGEGGGGEHPSRRRRHGGGCLSPRNSSISRLCAGTGSQPHFCFSGVALAHHPNGETKITLCRFPGPQGPPEFGKNAPFCDLILVVFTQRGCKLRSFGGCNKLHFPSSRIWGRAY